MSASSHCPHSGIVWHHHVTGFHDSNVSSVTLTAKCNICGRRMKLNRGLLMGASSRGPTLSADTDILGIMFPMVAEDEEPSKEWRFVITRQILGEES